MMSTIYNVILIRNRWIGDEGGDVNCGRGLSSWNQRWENLVEIERRFTLVGRFAKARPPLEVIRAKL
nr:hypothetical protein Iba_chr11cCG11730 [Ipomoea batatas]